MSLRPTSSHPHALHPLYVLALCLGLRRCKLLGTGREHQAEAQQEPST